MFQPEIQYYINVTIYTMILHTLYTNKFVTYIYCSNTLYIHKRSAIQHSLTLLLYTNKRTNEQTVSSYTKKAKEYIFQLNINHLSN